MAGNHQHGYLPPLIRRKKTFDRSPDNRKSLPIVLLTGALQLIAPVVTAEDRVAQADIPAARVSLNDRLSQSDVARLRAQARGQANSSFIAYPQLILNGTPTSQSLPVQVYGSELAIDTQALSKLGVQIPGDNKAQWRNLEELGIAGRYNNSEQRINLVVPAKWLPTQSLQAGSYSSASPLQRGSGALLNYDLYSTRLDNGNQNTAASHEARLFSDWGALSSSGVVRWNDVETSTSSSGDYIRLDSFWRFTAPQNMLTYTLGDTLSGALSWTPTVRLGGVQISRNFASRPDLITFPLPRISGSATLPSALEVFVNDLRLTDQNIQPGPFVLETTPRLTGLGEVQVVTTDTLGRQVSQTVPFYVSPQLLRQGLWDYSASIGAPRRFYSVRSNDYDDDPVATGVARYGLSDAVTIESSGSVSGTLKNTGAGVVVRPGLLGVSNLSLAYGEAETDNGTQWAFGHEYRTQRFGISGQFTRRSRGYRDLSNTLDIRPNLRDSLQINGSINLRHQGNLNASYLRTRQFEGLDNEFLVIGYNRSLWRQVSMTLSVNQNLNDNDDRTWLASFNYYLNRPGKRPMHTGLRLNHDEKSGDTETLMTVRQQVEEYWDVGWDLAYSPNSEGVRQASATWWTPYAELQAGAYGDDNETNTFASVDGSLVTSFNEVFAANRINNSYAIVDTGDFEDIPVRQSNRIIGYTNRNGKLLLPNLVPYTENRLSIDVNDLPVDAQIDNPTLTIKPAELVGVRARFPIVQSHSAIVVIHDNNGKPMALGSRVLFSDTGATVVGHDGEAFIQNLEKGQNRIEVINNGSKCIVEYSFAPQPGSLPRIGPFRCEPEDPKRTTSP